MCVVPLLFVAMMGVALNQPVGHPLATALEAAATLALSLLGGVGALRAREAPAVSRWCLLGAALGLLVLPGWPRALAAPPLLAAAALAWVPRRAPPGG
jgi:hypothetical protein